MVVPGADRPRDATASIGYCWLVLFSAAFACDKYTVPVHRSQLLKCCYLIEMIIILRQSIVMEWNARSGFILFSITQKYVHNTWGLQKIIELLK